jgi:hypothetical protein
MPVESVVTGIADLNAAWPLGSDQKQFGDDHIRNIKLAVKTLLTGSEQLGFTTIELALTVPTTNVTFGGVIQRGSQVVVFLTQDATGGRTVTWDAAKFSLTPAAGEINQAPNGVTVCSFVGRSDAKLACYSVRTGAALIPALGAYGSFLMDNSGSSPNPRWQRMVLQANTQIVPGGTNILFSNVGNWDYRLLRVSALNNYGGAPFFLKIRKDTVGGGSAYITANNVICNNPSGPPEEVIAEQQEFRGGQHFLYIEIVGSPPSPPPFMVCVAYEPFEG